MPWGAMPVSCMALTRDWISATVNHPDHAVMGRKPLLAVSGCRRVWRLYVWWGCLAAAAASCFSYEICFGVNCPLPDLLKGQGAIKTI